MPKWLRRQGQTRRQTRRPAIPRLPRILNSFILATIWGGVSRQNGSRFDPRVIEKCRMNYELVLKRKIMRYSTRNIVEQGDFCEAFILLGPCLFIWPKSFWRLTPAR